MNTPVELLSVPMFASRLRYTYPPFLTLDRIEKDPKSLSETIRLIERRESAIRMETIKEGLDKLSSSQRMEIFKSFEVEINDG
jgi:hypothetical protein